MSNEDEFTALQGELRSLDGRRSEILKRLVRLQESRVQNATPVGKPARLTAVQSQQEKVDLFLELFRARKSVFPRYWKNQKTGKSGYSPVCSNEWVPGICDKPRIKCTDCTKQAFIPFDEKTALIHLQGKETIGTYAICEDDQCRFLALDFDGPHFESDASAFRTAATRLGIDVAIERSRSGNGAHAWIFFSELVSAAAARQLGTLVLSAAASAQPTIELVSYDRMFPSQDVMPSGGFGNLIALPLQKLARESGNTVFVDDKFKAIDDQWAHLCSIRRLTRDDLTQFLLIHGPIQQHFALLDSQESSMAAAEQTLDPPKLHSLPIHFEEVVELRLSNEVVVDVAKMPARLVRLLKRTATLANPKFFELQRMRFSTWETPRFIFTGEFRPPDKLALPRGVLDKVVSVLVEAGARPIITDQRSKFKKTPFVFTGNLFPEQEKAVREITKNDFGVLVAPPGAGKTVMACALIAKRRVPTLVLVHRAPLLEQWTQRISEFLSIPVKEIGKIGSSKKKVTGRLDVAMVQSLTKMEDLDDFFAQYGMIVIDECHHIPAVTFEGLLRRAPARFILGLTATPYRKDGLQRILHMQAGPIRFEYKDDGAQPLAKRVVVRRTGFRMPESFGDRPPIHEVWEHIVNDPTRTQLIAQDVVASIQRNQVPVIISERKAHLEKLGEAIRSVGNPDTHFKALILTGEMGAKARRTTLAELTKSIEEKTPVCLLTTGSLIGEGFDLPRLDALFLTMPISFKGRLIQYAGRLHRSHSDKQEAVVYDYLDDFSALTKSMFKKRLNAYKAMGYKIEGHQYS